MNEAVSRPPIICLVTPFAGKDDYSPKRRGSLDWIRNRARRLIDMYRWRLHQRWEFHYSTYEDRLNSNRGDIAIRIASRDLLKQTFDDNVEIVEVGWDGFNRDFVASIDQHLSMVVIAGGGYFFLDQNGSLPARLKTHLSALESVSCPAVGLSLGLNQLLGQSGALRGEIAADSQPLAKRFLARLAKCSVRDSNALSVLKKVDDRVIVLPDPALFLTPRPSTIISRSDGELLIGLNLAIHGKETTPLLRAQFPLVVDALKRIAAAHNCRFVYFVHYDSERIVPRLLALSGISTTVVDCGPQEMLACYQQLDVHLCGMLHSAILACAAGAPPLHIAYDAKSVGFYDMMGLEQWILTKPFSANSLAGHLDDLISARHGVKVQIGQRRNVLLSMLSVFMKGLPALLR